MHVLSLTLVLAFCVLLNPMSCSQTPKTAESGQPTPANQNSTNCPPTAQTADLHPLGCSINNNNQVEVGNAKPTAIPKGTPIFFTAKLANAGAYCATVPAPQEIPPHLSISIPGQPIFDRQGGCQAWWKSTPVLEH